VRRTFIEYGCYAGQESGQQAVSTAPACMGFTMGPLLDSYFEYGGSPSTCSPSDAGRSLSEADWPVQGPSAPDRGGLPAVLYHLSPTSAKAAGYWTRDSYLRSNHSFGIPATGSFRTQDEAKSEAETTVEGDSEEEDDRGLCPEYSEGAKPPSLGSALHGEGACKRCCFFPKGRCNNGEDCQFCHFAHEKRKPKHKKKSKKRRKARRSAADAKVEQPEFKLQTAMLEFVGLDGAEEGCVLVPTIIPSQVVVPESFPHATAMAVIPVPFVY